MKEAKFSCAFALALVSLALACGDTSAPMQASHVDHADDAQEPAPKPAPTTKFELPALAAGYLRFETTPVQVRPKSSDNWAQWVGGPLDQDYDVVDITGAQSAGGHHALLYATPDEQAPGFTRVWEDADQLTTRLMGGVGGEGGASVELPAGIVFRVKKGSYLLVQTHFLNPWEQALVGRTVLDVKLVPVDPSHRVASIMSNTTLGIDLPEGESTVDVRCKVERDLQFLQVANHMHDFGKTTFSEFVDPSGKTHRLKSDKSWNPHWALAPNFSKYSVDAPQLVPAGSTLHTRCTWDNTTGGRVKFPAEMCVFFGFILSESDVYCTDGNWSSTTSSEEDGDSDLNTANDTPTNDDAEEEGRPVGAGGGVEHMAPDGAPPVASAGCTSSKDREIMESAEFDQRSTDCSIPCAFDPDVAACTMRCFREDVGLSPACAACNGTNVACGAKKCLNACVTDSASPACRSCVATNCDAAFQVCTAG